MKSRRKFLIEIRIIINTKTKNIAKNQWISFIMGKNRILILKMKWCNARMYVVFACGV